jgi:ferredoxin-NADP reductase
MPITWHDSIVTRIEPAAPNVRRFFVKVPDLEKIDFEAGQFVTMDLPIGDKRAQRWRSYSIANAPDGTNELEFCIVRSAEGAGSRYLFEQVEPGSVLRWKGPEGGFVLPADLDKDLVLICTGTGVAPFRSMIRDVQHCARAHRSIHLIFGARRREDILYYDEWIKLARTLPGFRFDVALSREPDWTEGYQGYVHQIYTGQYAQVRPDVAFYLCGWTKMIDEGVANLINMGYHRTQIHYELYG